MEPDFSKYDAAKLRQVLGTIDAMRFPDRVEEIKARLAALKQDEQLTSSMAAPSSTPLAPAMPILRCVGRC